MKASAVIVKPINKHLNKKELKQVLAAWNRMIDAEAGKTWWKKATLKSKREEYDYLMSGSNFVYLVFSMQKELLGEITGSWIDKNTAKLGYWLDPDYSGRGYMGMALKKVFAALKRKGCRKVLCSTQEINKKSIRLLNRIGAKYKGKSIKEINSKKLKYNKYEVLLND